MNYDVAHSVSFTGHRFYNGESREELMAKIRELHARGFRVFLSGMAVGFDMAAAEAVLACRESCRDIRLVAVVPFLGQEQRFTQRDKARFASILKRADEVKTLSMGYHSGVYTIRNNYLVDNCRVLVAWYDGSAGGTRYTLHRAIDRGREVMNIHPQALLSVMRELSLF